MTESRRRGKTEGDVFDGITDLQDMSLSRLWELVTDRNGLACCSPCGLQRVRQDYTTELNNDIYFRNT